MIIDGDYFVRVVPFPVPCGGMVMPNDDGTYSIYINADLSAERQRKALTHELAHIVNNDLYSGRDIRTIENI